MLQRTGSADLHVHTHYSDGLHSPAEVVDFARRAGVGWLAIADHDAVAGIPEGAEAAKKAGIGFVPAIELSVQHGTEDFHLLGYWVDPEDGALQELLREIVDARNRRAGRIINRLHALGIPLTLEDARRQVRKGPYIGRPHIAQALIGGGWVQSFQEAFHRFLGKDAPAYIPKQPLDPRRALAALRGAGAVSVLAHPGAYRTNGAWRIFLPEGLQGLEVWHPKHSAEQVDVWRREAERHGLVMTGGSDFHGKGISESEIGVPHVDARRVDDLAARKGDTR